MNKFLYMRYYFSSILLFLIISASHAQSGNNDWPLFRGKADLAGKVESEFPVSPKLLWSIKTGGTTKSSPVISDGTVYFGNDKGSLIAVSTDGKIKWKYDAGSSIDAAPIIFRNKIIFGTSEGVLKAIDRISGKLI